MLEATCLRQPFIDDLFKCDFAPWPYRAFNARAHLRESAMIAIEVAQYPAYFSQTGSRFVVLASASVRVACAVASRKSSSGHKSFQEMALEQLS